ncbi:MAG: LysR family transcriptional regulator [Xanthobacteraceae bacterium]|jgi:DNA-binding transcriptional LysR family regulator
MGNKENGENAMTLSVIPMSRTTDWESRIGRRVTLRDLHVLSTVVRWGSMAKAASHLAMSQSAVSESIAHLEDAIRVRLLDRTPQGIAPTIYAETLLKRGHVIFDELQQAVKDIEFLANPTVGEVRIAIPEFLTEWLLPTAIDKLSRRYPQIVVRVFQPNTMTLEHRELQDRSVDLVVTRVPRSFASDIFDMEALFDDPHFVVAGKGSRWAEASNIILAELENEPWTIPPSPVIDTLLQEIFETQGLKPPSKRVIAGSVVLRMHLLATGRFLSLFPTSVLRTAAQQWSIKTLPFDLRAKAQPIAILTLKNRTLSAVAQLLIEELREAAKDLTAKDQ